MLRHRADRWVNRIVQFSGCLRSVPSLLRLLAILPILTFAGCMVGPNFSTPKAKLSADYLDAGKDVQPNQVSNAAWWRNFNDPVLDRLIETGYQNNLSLQVAGLRVLQARAQLAAAVGDLYPQSQALVGGYSYERQSRASASNIGGASTFVNAAQLGLTASWELDFWGKYRRAVQANDAAFLGSIQAYDAALVSLTASIAQSYISIRTLALQVSVAQSNISAQSESLRIATVQYNSGQTSLLDVDQAQTQLGVTQASLPALQAQLVTQQDALAVLLGTTPDAMPPLLAGGNGIPQPPATVAVGIPKDLLRQRPDVVQAELAAAAECASLGVAKAQLYPALSLTGTFGFESANTPTASLGDLFRWSSRTVSLGPSLQIPIFNYGQLTNQVRAQDAVFEQSILTYQNTVLQAQQEVQDAISNYVEARNTVAALQSSAQSAIQSTKLAMIRYVDGATDYTTVLSAEQAQLQVQNSLAIAQGNVPLTLVALYSALGGGWQIAQGHDVVPEQVEDQMRARTNWGGLLAPQPNMRPRPIMPPRSNRLMCQHGDANETWTTDPARQPVAWAGAHRLRQKQQLQGAAAAAGGDQQARIDANDELPGRYRQYGRGEFGQSGRPGLRLSAKRQLRRWQHCQKRCQSVRHRTRPLCRQGATGAGGGGAGPGAGDLRASAI